VILLDTSGLLAAHFPRQRHHEACAEVLRSARGPFILSPFVLAEFDYLTSKLVGVDGELAMLDEVVNGAYVLAEFGAADVGQARNLIARHRDLRLGLADASIAVLAHRLGTRDVLTLDTRHFGALRGPKGKGFRLLPRDA
jgi:predicted nucleic acid-binding protein